MKTAVIVLAFLALAPATAARGDSFSPLSREEAAKGGEACVTGVVTFVAHWQKHSFIFASPDDPNGVALYATGEHPDAKSTPLPEGGISVGDIVEVRGKWAPLLFATGIYATRYVPIGRMELPAAPPRELHDFVQGRCDNRRSALAGVVQDVRAAAGGQVELLLATREGRMCARARMAMQDAEALEDAEVVLSGVAMSRFNHRAEFMGAVLEVAEKDGIAVVKPAPENAFDVREVALNAILAWSPDGLDGHRVKVKGTVTFAHSDGVFYLQSGETALRVSSDEPPPVDVSVDVVGFPSMVDGVGQLTQAVWRERGEPPEPIEVVNLSANTLTNVEFRADVTIIEYDCRKASLDGRLSRVDEGPEGFASLVLDVSGRSVRVNMDGETPKWVSAEAAYAPLVRVVGIARFDMSGVAAHGRRPWPNSLVIEAKGEGAVTLVPDAEWRARKLAHVAKVVLNAIALVPFVLLAVGAVVWRRAVYRRRRRELLSVERRRMADDLHDTIEQHLAGAKILLSTAADKLGKDGAAAERAVKMAGEVLAEAKHQIRDVILNLRSDELVSESADSLIVRMAKDISGRGIARVRVMLRGLPESLNVGAKADLVAIVQQAVTNGIKHGGAKNVVIVCDPAGRRNGNGFVLRILNDGKPFDASKALGPESGHFGLANMRERAKRSGMSIEWRQEGKWMCVKVVRG